MSSSSYRQVKKDVAYTVTPGRWTKDDQALLDAKWDTLQDPLRAQRRQNAVSIVNGASPARELTETEKAEMMHRQARLKAPQRSKPTSMLSTPTLAYIDASQAPKRLSDRFKSICANIWRNAFDSER